MDHYIIIARSVTYAQRMQRALARAGVRCQIFRAPLTALHRESLDPVQIFLYQRGLYQEVGR